MLLTQATHDDHEVFAYSVAYQTERARLQHDSGSQPESHKCHALTNRGELRLHARGRCARHFARNRLANESLGSITRGRIVRLCGAQLIGPWRGPVGELPRGKEFTHRVASGTSRAIDSAVRLSMPALTDFNRNLRGSDGNSQEMNGTHPDDIDGWERLRPIFPKAHRGKSCTESFVTRSRSSRPFV